MSTTDAERTGASLAAHDSSYYEDERLWGQEAIVSPEHIRMRLDATHALLPPRLERVLDVGAGDGRIANDLVRREDGPATLVALDRSMAALRHVTVTTVEATGAALPFPDRSFSAVLLCEVLEHLPPPVFADVVSEAARVAEEYVFVTVPYREDRKRGSVTCQVCGCTYNAFRHLRSFDDGDLVDLVPGFSLVEARQAGPRAPVYPRALRRLLEGSGLVSRSWYPQCPLCASVYDPAGGKGARRAAGRTRAPDADPEDELRVEGRDEGRAGGEPAPSPAPASDRRRRSYHTARALVPKARHRYWICALYRRR